MVRPPKILSRAPDDLHELNSQHKLLTISRMCMYQTNFGGLGRGFEQFLSILDPWSNNPKRFLEQDLFSLLKTSNRPQRSRYLGPPIQMYPGFKVRSNGKENPKVKVAREMFEYRNSLIQNE